MRKPIKSFDNLKHGDKIISPIDNEITAYYVGNNNEKYLASKSCIYPLFQFEAEDFYYYDGEKEVGEKDIGYFK